MSVVVVKLGGHVLDDITPENPRLGELASDILTLRRDSLDVVLVHGGGPQISALLEDLNIPSRFAEGLRVTDAPTMTAVAMALQWVNAQLVAALGAHGLPVVGVNGADQGLFCSRALGREWQRAGERPVVTATVLTTLLASGVTPIVAPFALDDVGHFLNCNADVSAGAIAASLAAETLYFFSDISQIRRESQDPASGLSNADAATLEAMISSGEIHTGMVPKVRAALDALRGGAASVVLADGREPHALQRTRTKDITTTEIRL